MDLERKTVKPKPIANRFKKISYNGKLQQIIVGVVMFCIIYGFIASSVVPKKYNLSVDDIATEDIQSPKDGKNSYATQKKIDEAMQKAEKVYAIDNSVRDQAIKNVKDFFAKVLEIKQLQNVDENVKVQKLKLDSPISLAEDDYASAVNASVSELRTLQEYLMKNLYEVLSQEISIDENGMKAKQDEFASNTKRDLLKLNNEVRNLGIDIGFAVIKPNMVYDGKATEQKVKEDVDSVSPVMIKKGQFIVKRGDVITEEQVSMLKDVDLLEQQNKIDLLLRIGIMVLVVLLEGLVIIYMYRFSPGLLKDRNKLILMGIIITIELMFTKFVSAYGVSGYLVPVAFATMLISILMKPRLALVVNISLSIIVALMTGYNLDTFIVALIGGSAGAIAALRMHQRYDLLISGLMVSLVNAFSILGIGLIGNAELVPVLKQSLLGIINGGLSSIFTLGLLPFCETTFDVVTPIKLLELSNPNQPLLKKLLFEAPGTYHHSILVGNLAEAAVDAIGGNSLLARVGSYYHDIGKIKRPYFFKENQITNENPHDKITPSLSTLIITNHVKDGVELAKKHKIPTVIRDMIEQHHGTTLVKYFYIKAVNDCDPHDEVAETQFRYEGPKPTNKETAVVMLADSVEAAVRSISSPTKVKIEEMVNKIIKDKLDDGQLDECDLTLRDLNHIGSAFLNVLNGIYHDRIEYPDEADDKGGDMDDADDRQ